MKPIIPITAVLMAAAITVGFIGGASASDADTPYDWCFTPNSEHLLPEVMEGKSFFREYDVIYGAKTDEKVVYLTFDAGYDKGTHGRILDALAEADVPAVFFFDGNVLKSSPELVRRALSDGHIVGNHTLFHPDMTLYCSDRDKYVRQIEEWNDLYSDITSAEPVKIMRFPMGRFSKRCLDYNRELGYCSVFWSFAYFDYDDNSQPTEEEALEKICARIHPGAVLLLHSTSETNARIIGKVITSLKEQGYRFGTLSEMLI